MHKKARLISCSIIRVKLGKILTLKFTYSEKATKIDKIFTVDFTVCSNCQIDGEDFVNFCGLLRKRELYLTSTVLVRNIFLK